MHQRLFLPAERLLRRLLRRSMSTITNAVPSARISWCAHRTSVVAMAGKAVWLLLFRCGYYSVTFGQLNLVDLLYLENPVCLIRDDQTRLQASGEEDRRRQACSFALFQAATSALTCGITTSQSLSLSAAASRVRGEKGSLRKESLSRVTVIWIVLLSP